MFYIGKWELQCSFIFGFTKVRKFIFIVDYFGVISAADNKENYKNLLRMARQM